MDYANTHHSVLFASSTCQLCRCISTILRPYAIRHQDSLRAYQTPTPQKTQYLSMISDNSCPTSLSSFCLYGDESATDKLFADKLLAEGLLIGNLLLVDFSSLFMTMGYEAFILFSHPRFLLNSSFFVHLSFNVSLELIELVKTRTSEVAKLELSISA